MICTSSSDGCLLGILITPVCRRDTIFVGPRPSGTFPGHGDAPAPTANGAAKYYWNAADNEDAYFHAAA